ncbi:MAG: LysR family transcriptional regulator [Myxococcaceae bacterium]|jgi:DNA-binding transcriptional LysR family regulator|nr:LysR family transcriptional regulator [Myxococcaceae bacterium]
METQIDLQLLETFAAVAEQSSFSKAAAKLGVAKGTVSRSIAQLEALLGVELLHRTTHHVSLSTAGAALHERTRGHLTALRSAVVDLPEREEAPAGLLRMTAAPDFGAIVLPPVLAAFSRRFPAVRFDVRLSGHQVDLVKDGYDLAIRVATAPLKDSTLTARRLGRGSAAFYASPSYVARRGRPKQLGDERHTWVLHHGFVRFFKLRPETVHFSVDDFLLARDLMRDGVGVGGLPTFVARAFLREGLLEEVPIGGTTTMGGDLVMLYPSSGQTPRKVTAFRDFLVEALRAGV